MPLKQWLMRITAFADRLLDDLEDLDWPESIKKMQHSWIGRSPGTDFDFYVGPDFPGWKSDRESNGFPVAEDKFAIRIFTTRPDTIFGATYLVLAPEHPLVSLLTSPEQEVAVKSYCLTASQKSDMERTSGSAEKTGVFTGSFAANPVNGELIPIWISDYVLVNYATGAIMAVPCHDDRDFDFAVKHQLAIRPVVDPGPANNSRDQILAGKAVFTGLGTSLNSGEYDGVPTEVMKQRITGDFESMGVARSVTRYKMRDWLFSRQRYWGEPFPILHELDEAGKKTGVMRAVDFVDLPVTLPKLDDYKPHGRPEPMLEKASPDWLNVTLDGKRYKRETNTMPQWAGSCWYYLRFIDPRNEKAFVDPEKERAWMPVDLYVGGAEHAVLHLLYSRFWHKVLFDRGFVSTPEPFGRLVNQGMILGEVEHTGFQIADGQTWVSLEETGLDETGQTIRICDESPLTAVKLQPNQVSKQGDGFVIAERPEITVESKSFKMSKSRGNVVNPDDIIVEFGADTLRLYEMFMGPFEATKSWNQSGLKGIRGFLDRVWRALASNDANRIVDCQLDVLCEHQIHRLIKVVTGDIETLGFNTAIARMMEFSHFLQRLDPIPRTVAENFLKLLAPFAPHLAEELWEKLGHLKMIANENWPTYDDGLAQVHEKEIPVQINGRLRGTLNLDSTAELIDVKRAIDACPRLKELIGSKKVIRLVYRPGKIVNIVLKEVHETEPNHE